MALSVKVKPEQDSICHRPKLSQPFDHSFSQGQMPMSVGLERLCCTERDTVLSYFRNLPNIWVETCVANLLEEKTQTGLGKALASASVSRRRRLHLKRTFLVPRNSMRIFVVGSNGVSLAIRLAGMRSLQLGWIERPIGQIYLM